MPKPYPYRRLPINRVREEIASHIRSVEEEGQRIVIMRYQTPVAVLVPMRDLELLSQFDDRLREMAARLVMINGVPPNDEGDA
jgi:PHD/YefM family antitoxin component YafN of YafNO toxin-antitoxin module